MDTFFQRNKIFNQIGLLSLSKVILYILSFVVHIALARLLTKEDFGIISTLGLLSFYFTLMADFGVTEVAQKEIISKSDGSEQMFSSFSHLRMFLGAIAGILFFITGIIWGYGDKLFVLAVISTSIPLFNISKLSEVLLKCQSRFSFIAITETSVSLVIVAVRLLIIYWLKDVQAFFLGILIGYFIQFGVFYIIRRTVFPEFALRSICYDEIFTLLKKSAPLFLGTFFYTLYNKVDVLFIEKMLGVAKVAEYNMAFNMLERLNAVFVEQVVVVFFPMMVTGFMNNRILVFNKINKALLVLLIIIGLGTALSYYVSEYFFVLLFTKKYIYSSQLFNLMLPTMFLNTIFLLYFRFLIISDNGKYYLFLTMFGAIIKSSLNIIFIKSFGLKGVIAATYIVQGIIILALFLKTKRIVFEKSAIKGDSLSHEHI